MGNENNKGHCRDCFYGRVSERSNTAANVVEYMACKRYPIETKHRPDNWCGEWKSR